MSSTLVIYGEGKHWHFAHPVKGFVAKAYYDHDGSLTGWTEFLKGEKDYLVFQGIKSLCLDSKDAKDLSQICDRLDNGEVLQMHIEC